MNLDAVKFSAAMCFTAEEKINFRITVSKRNEDDPEDELSPMAAGVLGADRKTKNFVLLTTGNLNEKELGIAVFSKDKNENFIKEAVKTMRLIDAMALF